MSRKKIYQLNLVKTPIDLGEEMKEFQNCLDNSVIGFGKINAKR